MTEGDVGKERRQVFYGAMMNAMDVVNHPGFGEPKRYCAHYADKTIKDWGIFPREENRERVTLLSHIQHLEETGETLPFEVAKLWPDTNQWEVCWREGKTVTP